MYLQEEYFTRKSVPAHLICYPEHATLYLKSKRPRDYNWLQMSINYHLDPQRPPRYLVNIQANPVINASPDFSHFSLNHTKTLLDEQWEWDAYEQKLLTCIDKYSKDYEAIYSKQALFSSWEMFLQNYDMWIANFLPHFIVDTIALSFVETDEAKKFNFINEVETFIKYRFDKFYNCWNSIRNNIDRGHYADWLAKVINNFEK